MQSLFDIAHTKLGVERPTYRNLNKMIAQIVSSFTTPLRYDGVLNTDLNEFLTNLVPFPRIHFPVVSYAPFLSIEQSCYSNKEVDEITETCFETVNQTLKCDVLNGKFIAVCLLYRGDVTPSDVNSAIYKLKAQRRIDFVNWCQTGFKVCPEENIFSVRDDFTGWSKLSATQNFTLWRLSSG